MRSWVGKLGVLLDVVSGGIFLLSEWGLLDIFGGIIFGFGFAMIVIDLWPHLVNPDPAEPDVWLLAGLHHAATGSWRIPDDDDWGAGVM